MDSEQELIEVSVTWSSDEYLAYVSGTLHSPMSPGMVVESIKEALKKNGIVFGLLNEQIGSAAAELVNNKCVNEALVARGTYPKPGITSDVDFTVKTYAHSDFEGSTILESDTYIHFAQLQDHVENPYMVKKGEHVGTFSNYVEGEDGCNIFGEKVEGSSCQVGLSEKLGPNLIPDKDSCKITADISGIIIRGEKKAYILPIIEDGLAHIHISDDQLKAYLYLAPSGPNGKPVTKDDVKKLLDEKMISFGILYEAIETALDRLRISGKKIDKVLIAEGKPAIPGKDSKINYFVDLSFSKKPKIIFDDKADYFSIHMFETVVENQRLAEIIPPSKGEDGTDIFKNQILARPGEDIHLSLGKNVKIQYDEIKTIIALKTGHVYMKDDTLLVEELLTIESNVDFNTGNVRFNGDILVKGDVLSRFSIKADGTVYIEGTVEDARIRAGGSVIVKGGFVGKGNGRIKADNDVIVKYVLNQTIIAKNHILIEGESLDANLFSGNCIIIEKSKSWLIGGSVVACNSVRAYDIGSELNNKTNISCGKYLFVQNMLKESENRIVRLKREIADVNKKIEVFAKKNLNGDTLGKFEKVLRDQLQSLQGDLEVKKTQFEKNEKYYKAVFNEDTGEVTVAGTIYPGVTLKIGHHNLKNHNELQRCMFFVKDDGIECTSMTG